jgi:hypothetical protein
MKQQNKTKERKKKKEKEKEEEEKQKKEELQVTWKRSTTFEASSSASTMPWLKSITCTFITYHKC